MNAHWYKDAIFYQLHVKCFKDGNGDGIGDFKGLTEKLDYIQELGCTAIWLQPFYPSPLLDDGYDIADYFAVHPDYGTLDDFKKFLKEAHDRDIKVVTELVINHTSDQHQWFQRAREAAPDSKWRNYYMWSDTPEKYSEARIIFKDFEHSNWQWDPVAKAYYWHRFYSHQPDLNYDSPDVQEEILKILDFWMQMGVDGMRLDAIPYLYAREGTDCENLPETHAFLAKLRAHVDAHYPGRMLLAEANQWPEQAAKYFGNEDECHMAFHFPVMPRLFMALRLEDRFPILDIMEQTPKIPDSCQWAVFLRNHDELTLEMVTDEERDFMYRSYAKDPRARINLGIRRRLAPLLDNDRSKIELMYNLLFSLSGSPIIYYGDEIGMGDNYYLGDRNGVRTPMQWNNDRNAGFSVANPQKLYLPLIIEPQYHHSHLNVENQENGVNSLLSWMRRTLRVRKNYQAFGRGDIRFLKPANPKILAFIRTYQEQSVLIVVNLSRFSQYVELSLDDYAGAVPRDVISMNSFAPIRKDQGYGLTIGGYQHYWLLLEKESRPLVQGGPVLELSADGWENIFKRHGKLHRAFLQHLERYIASARWFRAKNKTIKGLAVVEDFAMDNARLLFVKTTFTNDEEEIYCVPVAYQAEQPPRQFLIASGKEGYLIDAISDPRFQEQLLEAFAAKRKLQGKTGKLTFRTYHPIESGLKPALVDAEQTNSSVIYGKQLFLKIYRQLEEGINPDIEMQLYLTGLSCIPAIAGTVEWTGENQGRIDLGMLQNFVPNSGDMWTNTLKVLRRYYEDGSDDTSYLKTIVQLGQSTAAMHMALADAKENAMKPEPFTPFAQNAKYQWMRTRLKRVIDQLKGCFDKLEPATKELAEQFIAKEDTILNKFRFLIDARLNIVKIRTHGDFHLGQVLHGSDGPMIIDFEGEPALPMGERRLKRLALQDVASMIRSFDYAAQSELLRTHSEKQKAAGAWCDRVSSIYLDSYLETVKHCDKPLVPSDHLLMRQLLDAFILHKAVYEIGYEIQNRPSWVAIPLTGILKILGAS